MAGSIRLHVPGPLAEGARLTLPEAQAHYVGRVMRRGPGDALLLFDGVSGEFAAVLETLDKRGATVALGARTRAQRAEPDLWLAFALLKRDATDLVVRQATEMGVARILPVVTAHAVAGHTNAARLRAIAAEAAEQSERLTVPALDDPVALDALLAGWPEERTLWAAIERQPGQPPEFGPRGGVLIGPEGGFSPSEIVAVRRHRAVRPLWLGPRILRAETAAVAALARVAQNPIESG